MKGLNQKEPHEFLEGIKSGFKTETGKADNRVIVSLTYDFDLGGGIELGEVLDTAVAYVNDQEVANISFAEGDPTKKTITVDVTGAIVPGQYNVFQFKSYVLKEYFGFDISSESNITIKVKGKNLVKEEFETKAMIRLVDDFWIHFIDA